MIFFHLRGGGCSLTQAPCIPLQLLEYKLCAVLAELLACPLAPHLDQILTHGCSATTKIGKNPTTAIFVLTEERRLLDTCLARPVTTATNQIRCWPFGWYQKLAINLHTQLSTAGAKLPKNCMMVRPVFRPSACNVCHSLPWIQF